MSIAKKIIISGLLSFACTAFAQSKDFRNGSSEVRVSAGGKGLAGTYMVEYERRASNQGLSVFGSFTSNRTQVGQFAQTPETWMLGVGAPIHLVDNTDFDVFIAPEVAVTYVKNTIDVPGTTPSGASATTFGPGLKIGTIYAFNSTWGLGFEFATYTNWFSEKLPTEFTTASLTLGYRW